ncbi:MAG: hypothetical protein ACRD40_08380 [Candidatus Acidiferrales bacterium]
MPEFRIHRLKDSVRQHFRLAPHTSGASLAKPKDYEPGSVIETSSVYAAWAALRESDSPLLVGDILESEDGSLRICKYVGFEEVNWVLPQPPGNEAVVGLDAVN